MPYVYAIIKDEDSLHLHLMQKYISRPQNVEPYELAQYFDYATSLSDPYCSCIPETSTDKIGLSKSLRLDALAMEKTICEVEAENDVVAISHRRGGFTDIDWYFGEDIAFHIYTNFGYGSMSDFTSTFMYNNIILAPYSYYVKYKDSTYATVTRCTNCYKLEYTEWRRVMTDCLNFYNALINSDETYIFNWLEKHLSEMVSGLERFLSATSCNFIDSYENNHVSKMAYVSGDDFWLIKSQKIAHSIDFIENLKILPVEINTQGYIKRIISLYFAFLPMLKDKINQTSEIIDKENSILQQLKASEDYPLYNRLYEKYNNKKEWFFSANKFKKTWFLMHLLKRINPNYNLDEIRIRLKSLNKLIEKVTKQAEKVSDLRWFLRLLNEELEYMQKHVAEMQE